MDKLNKELKAILEKDDVKNLLERCLEDLADIKGIIVIVQRPNGQSRIHSTVGYVRTIVELETSKILLVEEKLGEHYEGTEE